MDIYVRVHIPEDGGYIAEVKEDVQEVLNIFSECGVYRAAGSAAAGTIMKEMEDICLVIGEHWQHDLSD